MAYEGRASTLISLKGNAFVAYDANGWRVELYGASVFPYSRPYGFPDTTTFVFGPGATYEIKSRQFTPISSTPLSFAGSTTTDVRNAIEPLIGAKLESPIPEVIAWK